MQQACQWGIIMMLAMDFLIITKRCFHGRKAVEPMGFEGFIFLLISMTIIFAVHYFAGSFSLILR